LIDDSGGQKSEAEATFDHRAAVLECSFSADAAHAFSGALDTVVKELDLTTEKIRSIGMHDHSVSSMTFVRSTAKPCMQHKNGYML